MSMRVVDIVWDMGRKMSHMDLCWYDALREVANRSTSVVPMDITVLQHARRELGDDWASLVYDVARTDVSVPAMLDIDEDPTEPGDAGYVTLGQLVGRLTSMRDANPDAASMKVVLGPAWSDLDRVEVGRRASRMGDESVLVLLP